LVAGALVAGLLAFDMFEAVAFVAGVVTVAGVEAGVDGLFAFALVAGALLAAPPQAMPSALNPRTVENITFFILFKTPNLTQLSKYLFPGTGRS
jgi:hypothetical protein